MAVKFKKSNVFKVEVTFAEPNDQGGFDENTFVAHFKRTNHAETKALRTEEDIEVVRKQLVGWDMVDEDTKQAVPYSEEAREGLLQMSSAPYHLALAFFRASSGNKAKNS